MGISTPSKKVREKICLECNYQCEEYVKNKKTSYSPLRAHKVPINLSVFPEDLYKNFYQYCKFYNPLKILRK